MKCPICHSNRNLIIFTSSNFHGHKKISSQKIIYSQCQHCNCIFPNIKVNKKFYSKYYSKKYYQHPSILEKIYYHFTFLFKSKYFYNTKSLLDVGCGNGDFMRKLPSNINTIGIDIKKTSQLNIINDDFLKHKFYQKFDTITFWHSLEHFSNPQKVIKKARSILNKKGRIIISIPNTNSLAFKISQNSWFHLDPPRHLFLPNETNIKLLFPKKSKIKINYLAWEFPLDLFWSLEKKPLYRLIYPFLKFFDHETMIISFESL